MLRRNKSSSKTITRAAAASWPHPAGMGVREVAGAGGVGHARRVGWGGARETHRAFLLAHSQDKLEFFILPLWI